jgi:hypothetical protein
MLTVTFANQTDSGMKIRRHGTRILFMGGDLLVTVQTQRQRVSASRLGYAKTRSCRYTAEARPLKTPATAFSQCRGC